MKRFLIILILLLLIVPPLSVMGQDDTLIYAHFQNPATLNPVFRTGSVESIPIYLFLSTLYDRDPETGLPVPGLTSWDISEDGLTITYTIRDDAFWSDGTPISSMDAKFTIDALASADLGSTWTGQITSIDAVSIVDDKTFEVTLKEVDCALFTSFNPPLLPAHKYAADYSDFQDNPFNTAPDISSGPYILEEWAQDQFLRYRANPTYFKGEPQIPNMIIRIIPDQAVLIQSLQAGESDFAWFLNDSSDQFSDTSNLDLIPRPAVGMLYLSMNFADPSNPQPAYDEDGNLIEQTPNAFFSDVRVREAIALGYNKDDVVTAIGGGTRAAAIIPPFNWAYDSEIAPRPYDPERAAQLLDEAGWVLNEATGIREKDGVPFSFELLSTNFLEMFDTTAVIIQDQLGALGIEISITSLEVGAFLERLLAQDYDTVVISGGVGNADPNGWFTFYVVSTQDIPTSGFNWDSFISPEADTLIQQARSMPGCAAEDRIPLYSELQHILYDNVVRDYVLLPNELIVVSKRIQNINLTPGNTEPDYMFPNIETWTLAE